MGSRCWVAWRPGGSGWGGVPAGAARVARREWFACRSVAIDHPDGNPTAGMAASHVGCGALRHEPNPHPYPHGGGSRGVWRECCRCSTSRTLILTLTLTPTLTPPQHEQDHLDGVLFPERVRSAAFLVPLAVLADNQRAQWDAGWPSRGAHATEHGEFAFEE